jgi:hypothetical protein
MDSNRSVRPLGSSEKGGFWAFQLYRSLLEKRPILIGASPIRTSTTQGPHREDGGPGGSGGGLVLWGFLWLPTGLSPLASPETGQGVQTGRLTSGEAQGGQLPLAGVARQQHMAGDLLQNLSLSRTDGESVLPVE